uniref:F-box domain-containing protein n=1 Tax=Caenorhabditis tropicalis TaxID=1561998 RepID=A0A1I7T1R2_9PELO
MHELYGNPKKLLEGQDFISALCEDIEELLRKQRRPYLNNFDLFLHSDPSDDTNNINERQEYVSMKFFEKFEEIMKRKRALLKVKSFNMNPHSQDQLLSVFRHLKPGVLETISLHSKNQTKRLKPDWQLLQSLLEKLPAETRALFTNIEENTNQIMPMLPAEMFDIYGIQSLKEPVNIELEKVVKMDQWKEAKQVITDNLIVSLPLGSLLNFQFACVKLKYISSDNLLLLKKLLQSGTPINMEIGYVHFSDHDLNNISYRNPFDVFGIPHKNSTSSTRIAELSSDPEKVIVKTWYLPTRDPDFYGCIRHRSDNIFVFSYAKKQGIREEKVIENDWTGLVLLVNVFPVVMENILKVTDLRSRLNLRKVCRDLRNFIDDTRIKTRERRIGISVLFNSIDTRFEENGESVRVYFKGDEEKCIVMREKAKENQKNHSKFDINVVNDLDFLTGFFNELDIVLGNHRSILDELQIDFPCFMEEEEVVDHEFGVKVLRRLKQYLEYKYYKISVKRLSINLFHQSQIIDILPYINPDKLEKVELINLKGVTGKLDIQEILKTEQWKKAKELELINFFIGLPAGSLTHFAKVKCCIDTIEAQNLMALKTACLASPKEFAIECQSFDTEDLYETFGRPLILVTEGVKTRNWFFRIPNNSENVVSLVIESLSLVTFSRVPVEDVPTNATIHD